jgi:hypothetical protein
VDNCIDSLDGTGKGVHIGQIGMNRGNVGGNREIRANWPAVEHQAKVVSTGNKVRRQEIPEIAGRACDQNRDFFVHRDFLADRSFLVGRTVYVVFDRFDLFATFTGQETSDRSSLSFQQR